MIISREHTKYQNQMRTILSNDSVILKAPTDFPLVNTNYFREDALYFKKNGIYCGAPENSREFKEFWDDRMDRCINGYKVGDVKITGYHYFYLNFCPIERLPDLYGVVHDVKKVDTVKDFPAFWDGDFAYFNAIELAENLGKHMLVLKARGKGYSFKGGSMCDRNFYLIPRSKSYCFAYEKEYLIKDGVLTKAWDYMDFLNSKTAWRKARQAKSTDLHRRASLLNGKDELGYMSEIIGVAFKDNPGKVRGKRGKLIQWEEFGSAPGGMRAWNIARKSVEQGRFNRGIMIGYGTGGQEGPEFEAMSTMFDAPDSFNILAFESDYEPGAQGSCAFFVPDYWNKEGFMDSEGNSSCEEAYDYDIEKREEVEQGGDQSALEQLMAEECHTPSEAMMKTGTNFFPSAEINPWISAIKANKYLREIGTNGFMVEYHDKGVSFVPSAQGVSGHNSTGPMPLSFPIGKDSKAKGCITVYESPFTINGVVPDDLYIICHDPYAFDETGKSTYMSVGSLFVIKRSNSKSKPDDVIVASYAARPEKQDDYNRQMFLLAQYYNAKIAFENDRGNVIGYAKINKLTKWLMPEFRYIKNEDGSFARSLSRGFGMSINDGKGHRKRQGLLLYKDWLIRKRGVDIDTEKHILNLHTVYDIPLLQETLKYSNDRKKNFDRVSAMIIGMYALEELEYREKDPDTENDELEDQNSFWNREMFV